MEKDLITVLMPVYNGSNYIRESIKGVLSQKYKNFELLIINDGSTDDSLKIVKEFEDSRIRLINNETNKGLIYTRNLGIKEANGKYIAFNDSDDISLQDRLSIQYSIFQQNPNISLCGSAAILINDIGDEVGIAKVVNNTNEFSKCLLLFSNIFINSSLMIKRKDILDYKLPYAEDYDLSERMVSRGSIVCNISNCLIKYRTHHNNTSLVKITEMINNERIILTRQLLNLNIHPTLDELNLHHCFLSGDFKNIKKSTIINWLRKIKSANKTVLYYDNKVLREVVSLQCYKYVKFLAKDKTVYFTYLISNPFFVDGARYFIKKMLKKVI